MMYKDWDSLKENCLQCRKCSLCETRTNVVFGVGRNDAEVLLIGEGPGHNEDMQGEPFVGRAGQLLDKFLAAVGIKRGDVYIANMVKCRPPENRDPLPAEQEQCIKWLYNQIELLSPKIIFCLGRISAMKFIRPDYKVTIEHGSFIEKDGILMAGTFHPASLLRNPRQKPDAFSDFRKLRDLILTVCNHTPVDVLSPESE